MHWMSKNHSSLFNGWTFCWTLLQTQIQKYCVCNVPPCECPPPPSHHPTTQRAYALIGRFLSPESKFVKQTWYMRPESKDLGLKTLYKSKNIIKSNASDQYWLYRSIAIEVSRFLRYCTTFCRCFRVVLKRPTKENDQKYRQKITSGWKVSGIRLGDSRAEQ